MVTAYAAAIMVCVFGSFVLSDGRTIKEFGLGLAVALLVDATIVRMILVRGHGASGQRQLAAAELTGMDAEHPRRRQGHAAAPDHAPPRAGAPGRLSRGAAEASFRRVKGRKDMAVLVDALGPPRRHRRRSRPGAYGLMEARQATLTGFRCHHAGDTVLRPDCAGLMQTPPPLLGG